MTSSFEYKRLALAAMVFPILIGLWGVRPLDLSSSSYKVNFSVENLGLQIFKATADNINNPSFATFSLKNGTQMWYSYDIQYSSPNLTIAPADPLNDVIAAAFSSQHLIPPTDVFPFDITSETYKYETLKLAASFTSSHQDIKIELNPFTYPAVSLDALNLLLQFGGLKKAGTEIGLLDSDTLKAVLQAFSQTVDLNKFVNDLIQVYHALPDVTSALAHATDCAGDIMAILHGDSHLVGNMLWRALGKAIPQQGIVDALTNFGVAASEVFGVAQFGLAVSEYVRDEILALSPLFLNQGQSTIELQTVDDAPLLPTATPLPPTATPLPGLQTVDWQNYTYTINEACDLDLYGIGSQQVPLQNGMATVNAGGINVLIRINQPVVYGDLTGEGIPEAAIPFACGYGTNRLNPVFIFSGDAIHPQELGYLPVRNQDPYWLIANNVIINNEQIQLIGVGYSTRSTPHCCPDVDVTYTYKWDGKQFQQINVQTSPATPSP